MPNKGKTNNGKTHGTKRKLVEQNNPKKRKVSDQNSSKEPLPKEPISVSNDDDKVKIGSRNQSKNRGGKSPSKSPGRRVLLKNNNAVPSNDAAEPIDLDTR